MAEVTNELIYEVLNGLQYEVRILKDGQAEGVVTSGSFSPSLERCVGMGYVRADLATVGTDVDVDIRGAAHRARVAKTPFVPSHAKKI